MFGETPVSRSIASFSRAGIADADLRELAAQLEAVARW